MSCDHRAVCRDDLNGIFVYCSPLTLFCVGRTLAQLEDDVAPCEAQMENWNTNLAVIVSKERQYLQQHANYKVLLI